MIVCVCQRVSDRDIVRHVRNGCTSFDELQMETGVASCCGRCADCARDTFDSACAAGARPPAQRAAIHIAHAA